MSDLPFSDTAVQGEPINVENHVVTPQVDEKTDSNIQTWYLKEAFIQNFKGISELKVTFPGGKLIKLMGFNGSGKSSIIDSIIWAFTGKKGFDPKARQDFLNGRKSEIKVTIASGTREITIKRTLTPKDTMKLEIFDSKGCFFDQNEIDEMFNIIAFNPIAFSELAPDDQARKLGVDTSEFDEKHKKLTQERLKAGQIQREAEDELKQYPKQIVPEKIDVQDLNSQQEKVREIQFNKGKLENTIENYKLTIIDNNNRIGLLKTQLESFEAENRIKQESIDEYQTKIDDCNKQLEALPSLEYLQQQIGQSSQINERAIEIESQNKRHEELQQKVMKWESIWHEKDSELKQNQDDKHKFIKNFELPESMTINDDGGLCLDGRTFNSNNFSTGEIIRESSQLLDHINKNRTEEGEWILRTIYIPRADSLDQHNQELLKQLSDDGLQVILEIAGEDPTSPNNTITIREFQVIQ